MVKTAKQTATVDVGYFETARQIIEGDGIAGLFLRGLDTKLASNGLQAMLFTVCWRYFEELLAQRNKAKRNKHQ